MALQEELEIQGNMLFRRRGILPVFMLLFALAIYTYREMNEPESISGFTDSSYPYFCFLISLTGLIIRMHIAACTPKNTSGRNTKEQVAEVLNTTGLYSICRHPLYAGNFIMWLGVTLLTQSPAFIVIFCLAFWLYYERIMFAEEQFLRRKFGEAYLSWAANTRAFIPAFKNWKKNSGRFSLQKMIRQEKTSLLSLMFVFCLFHVTGFFFAKKSFLPDILFWIIGLMLAVFIYIIVKTTENSRAGEMKKQELPCIDINKKYKK